MSTPQAFIVGVAAVGGIGTFTTNLPRVVLEAFFFGLYTVVVFMGYSAIARKPPRTAAAWAGLSACVVMYALATAHVGLNLQRLAIDVGRARELALIAAICMGSLGADGPDATCFDVGNDADIVNTALTPAAQGKEWVPIMFLVINTLLSTGILLWRGYARETRKALLAWVFSFLFFGLMAIYIIGTVINDDLEDGFGSAAVFTTWFLIVWLTGLATADIWRRRHEISRSLRDLSRGACFERVAYLVLDSCIVYAMFWTVMMAWCAALWADTQTDSGVRFLHAMRAFKASALVDIVGLYPTLLLVLAAMHETTPRRASRASLNVHPLARVRLSADSQATVHETAVPSVEIPKAAFAQEDDYAYAYGDVKIAGDV